MVDWYFMSLCNHIPTISCFKIVCRSKNKFLWCLEMLWEKNAPRILKEIHGNLARNLEVPYCTTFKGTQAWDNFEFFYRNQNLIFPWSIFGQNFASFPSIFARISMFEDFRGDWGVYGMHARKCLKVEYFSRIEYYFQKSRVTTGLWNHKVSVSEKNSKNKFHACVPLTCGLEI